MSITQKPKDFQILFLDMNSFFASVEQQVKPFLRQHPVGITPYVGDTGCIIAASQKAKQSGVKTGTKVGEAKRIDPSIKIIQARPALYMIYHKEIGKVLEGFSPFWQPSSVDEFIIKLTPSEQNWQASFDLACKIKQKIKSQVGDFLTCSVGIGPNRFLAKMVAESQKPDGLTIVKISRLKKFYQDLSKLTNITGINFRLESHLKSFNINSPLQLYQKSLQDLKRTLNHWGRLWYFRLRGYEVDDWTSSTKSVGHSHVLVPELRTREGAENTIKKLIVKAGYRLRKKQFLAKGISISIKFVNKTYFARSKAVPAFCDNSSFTKHVFQILNHCLWQTKPLLVAVSAINLLENRNLDQISMFPEIEKSRQISRKLDQIQDKFGPNAIFPASIFNTKDSAPDRIPYGKPKYNIRNE